MTLNCLTQQFLPSFLLCFLKADDTLHQAHRSVCKMTYYVWSGTSDLTYWLTNAAILFVVGSAAASCTRPGRYFNFESEIGRASLQLIEIEVSSVGVL